MTPSAQRVFISYARADRAYAEGVVRALERAGSASVWTDQFIIPGADWDAELRKTLADVSVVVLIVSAASLSSQWVNYEIGSAIAAGKRLIPVVVGDVASLPSHLRQAQVIDARGIDENRIGEKLAAALKKIQGPDNTG